MVVAVGAAEAWFSRNLFTPKKGQKNGSKNGPKIGPFFDPKMVKFMKFDPKISLFKVIYAQP